MTWHGREALSDDMAWATHRVSCTMAWQLLLDSGMPYTISCTMAWQLLLDSGIVLEENPDDVVMVCQGEGTIELYVMRL